MPSLKLSHIATSGRGGGVVCIKRILINFDQFIFLVNLELGTTLSQLPDYFKQSCHPRTSVKFSEGQLKLFETLYRAREVC